MPACSGAYVVVAVVAAVGTFVADVPRSGVSPTRAGFVAEPDERRIHTRVTPYGGGVAMFLAFLVAMVVASQIPASCTGCSSGRPSLSASCSARP